MVTIMRFRSFLVVMLFLLVIMMGSVAYASEIVKVGLLDNASEVTISNNDKIKVESSGLELIFDDQIYKVKKEDQFIIINNRRFKVDKLKIYSSSKNSLLVVNDRKYRGNLKVLNKNTGLTVINEVDFDSYLASVVGSEIKATWPIEVLKAQAVVARTYALRNLDSHQEQGYNLSATVRSQAYKGVEFEHPRTSQAVRDTHGEVAKYNEELIAAVYHSTAGGNTAQGATIWSSNTPYLQSVLSPDRISPHYSWKKEYSKSDIERILIKEGLDILSLKDITLKQIGPSGRPKSFLIHDLNGKVYEVDSSIFRFWLGLKSTKLIINRGYSLRLSRPMDKFSFDLTSLGLNSGFIMEDATSLYSFVGYGWGHGVGMSQWGAYQLAKDGYNYQQILHHYYQGIDIIREELEE